MIGSSAGTGTGSGSRYLNPHRVIELVIRRRPRQLLDYLDSIPGTSRDLHCHQVVLVGRTLLTLVSRRQRLPLHEEDRRILFWAEMAWFHVTSSRFCAPLMVRNPSNFTSDAGHSTHPLNSSSYSGRMLTYEPDSIELRHAAVRSQLSASNSRIHGATFPPLQASSSDVISFPTRPARMLDETSAFNSGTHASAYVPLRGNSTLGPYMHPHNSSSYSRSMLNRETDSNELIHSAASSSRTTAATLLPLQEIFDDVNRHAAMHNSLSASSSRIHAAMLPPLQANTMINFPTRHAGMRDETSASNSGTHALSYVPSRDNSMLAQEFAELSLGRLGSEHFTPQMLMQNTEDIKGKRPASEVKQIKAKILRLNVASVITEVGFKSAAGVLIRDGTTAPFMTALSFREILYVDPALLFATACCEGIRTALLYEPTTIVLESHLVPLLEHLVAIQSQAGEVVQLDQLLGSNPPYFIIQTIPEESNGAACQLVCHAFQMEKSKMAFSCKDPPDWLLPYLYQ